MHPILMFTLIGLGCAVVFTGVMAVANPEEIAAALRRIADAMESVKKERHDRDLMGIEVLGDIKGLLAQLVSRTSQAPPPMAASSSPMAASGPVLWEVCSKRDGDWERLSWVREGTDTYHEKRATPGIAVRLGDRVDEGVQ